MLQGRSLTLNEVWRRVTGMPLDDSARFALVGKGWTPAILDGLRTLARYAFRIQSSMGRDLPSGSDQSKIMNIHRALLNVTRDMAFWGGVRPEQGQRWLAALVAEMDDARCEQMTTALIHWNDHMRAWHAVGDLGPLAWLVGLSVEETLAQDAADALDADTLLTLLSLRDSEIPLLLRPCA